MRLIKIFIWLGLVYLQSFELNAQTKKPVAKFKVVPPEFEFFPYDDYLFVGYDNKIKVTCKSKNIKYNCKITNGTLVKLNDSIWQVSNLSPVKSLLSVYTIDTKGKERLVLNRAYNFVAFPKITVGGVKCDSSITDIGLAAGTFYATFKNIGRFKIEAFKMEMYQNKTFAQDSTTDGRLTKNMLDYIKKCKPGSLICFKDLKFRTADGTWRREPIYRVFLIEDKTSLIRPGF